MKILFSDWLFCFLMFLFFCCRDELNLLTLKVFVGLHEFSDLNLVQALRCDSPPGPCSFNRFSFHRPVCVSQTVSVELSSPGRSSED